MKIIPILIVMMAIVFPSTARAQATGLSFASSASQSGTPFAPEMQGVWGYQHCDWPFFTTFSPYFALHVQKSLHRFQAIESWRREEVENGTIYSIKTSTFPYMIKSITGGPMRMKFNEVDSKSRLASGWGTYDDMAAPPYVRCVSAPQGMTVETESTYRLSEAYEGCRGVSAVAFPEAGACHKALFAVVDRNRDGGLDHDELTTIYRQAFFVMDSAAPCSSRDYPGNSAAEAEEFASQVLGTEKSISFDALMDKARKPDFVHGRVYNFAENARNTRFLLPFMPLADKLKTCVLGDPTSGTVPLPEEPATAK